MAGMVVKGLMGVVGFGVKHWGITLAGLATADQMLNDGKATSAAVSSVTDFGGKAAKKGVDKAIKDTLDKTLGPDNPLAGQIGDFLTHNWGKLVAGGGIALLFANKDTQGLAVIAALALAAYTFMQYNAKGEFNKNSKVFNKAPDADADADADLSTSTKGSKAFTAVDPASVRKKPDLERINTEGGLDIDKLAGQSGEDHDGPKTDPKPTAEHE